VTRIATRKGAGYQAGIRRPPAPPAPRLHGEKPKLGDAVEKPRCRPGTGIPETEDQDKTPQISTGAELGGPASLPPIMERLARINRRDPVDLRAAARGLQDSPPIRATAAADPTRTPGMGLHLHVLAAPRGDAKDLSGIGRNLTSEGTVGKPALAGRPGESR